MPSCALSGGAKVLHLSNTFMISRNRDIITAQFFTSQIY